jgi:fructose-bisphosphate aldolase class I
VRVLALSGGYSREECNNRLRRNHGIVASFSRALVEGLSVKQSDAEYNTLLDESIQSIFEASTIKTDDHQNIGEQLDSRSRITQTA